MLNKIIDFFTNLIMDFPNMIANGIIRLIEFVVAISLFLFNWVILNLKTILFVVGCGTLLAIISLFTENSNVRMFFNIGALLGILFAFLNWIFHSGTYS